MGLERSRKVIEKHTDIAPCLLPFSLAQQPKLPPHLGQEK